MNNELRLEVTDTGIVVYVNQHNKIFAAGKMEGKNICWYWKHREFNA